jgi:hypothetical protein
MDSKSDSTTNKQPPGCDPSIERDRNRDPEDRSAEHKHEIREKMLDKTLADSFPTSDPPSSIPNPEEEDSLSE